MNPLAPTMPDANAAMKYSAPANLMPPMPKGTATPAGLMPPAAAPMMPPEAAPAAPPALPTFAAPTEPTEPPYKTRTQTDGTIAIVWPSPDGDPAKDIVSQVFPAPNIPKALQPPKAAQ